MSDGDAEGVRPLIGEEPSPEAVDPSGSQNDAERPVPASSDRPTDVEDAGRVSPEAPPDPGEPDVASPATASDEQTAPATGDVAEEPAATKPEGAEDGAPDGEAAAEAGDAGGEPAAPETEGGDVTAPVATISDRPMLWYVLRVASNREEQVCKALQRKVAIEHLENRIDRILVPTQREKRMRGRVAKVFNRKLYPGYVFVEMATEEDGSIPEDVWFMVKETMSVGDFIGSDGKPTAMKPHDVEKMLAVVEKSAEQPTLAGMAGMKKGDPIKVKEGPFENFEGEIDDVFPDKGQVRVIVTIFGRATPIDLEYWQIELT
jgi:transcriptional antiterminator NusG